MANLTLLPDGKATVTAVDPTEHLLVFTTKSAFTGLPTDQWSVQDVTDAIGTDSAGRTYKVVS